MNKDPLQLWLPATSANDPTRKPEFKRFQQFGKELRRQHDAKAAAPQAMRLNTQAKS